MQYEIRIVAFVDIIGWQEATMVNPMYPLVKKAIEVFVKEHGFRKAQYKNEVKKRFGKRTNPLFLGVECAIFSDNIIILMPGILRVEFLI